MPVEFRKLRMHDNARPQTVEDSFRAYGNFSGIHDYNFDLAYSKSSVSFTGATPDTWNLEVDTSYALPNAYVLSYHKSSVRHAVVVNWQPNGNYWLVGTDENGYPFVGVNEDGAYRIVLSIPEACPTEADVRMAFREMTYSGEAISEDTAGLWHAVSVWMNDALVLTYSQFAPYQLSGTWHVGFATYGTTEMTITNISIPEITEFAEWSSIDPGEFPIGGLQRAIEGRYLRFFLRHNGELRAWRPKTTSPVLSFNSNLVDSEGVNIDYRGIKSHIRFVGAYVEAEYADRDMIRKYGHRFHIEQNPYVMSREECYQQAYRTAQRMLSEAITEDFESVFTPLLEPEDHIETPEGERIVSARVWSIGTGEIVQAISSRLYTYGS